ncbi:MAG: acyl carrier protein [Halorhodospira sp.]
MNDEALVLDILDRTLELGGRAQQMTRETPLLGALPELDSMAVVWLVEALEEELATRIEDDEITAELFATVGTLADFVTQKRAAQG